MKTRYPTAQQWRSARTKRQMLRIELERLEARQSSTAKSEQRELPISVDSRESEEHISRWLKG